MTDGGCTIDGCGKKVVAKGMCAMHYKRERRHGSPQIALRNRHTPAACSIDGCEKRVHAQGLCDMHYRRHMRGTEQADQPGRLAGGSLFERMARHIPAPDTGGHQVWTSQVTGRETPVLKLTNTMLSARRLVWEQAHGAEPPTEMVIVTTCGVERCVAPDHLVLAERGYHLRDRVTSQ